MLFERIKSDLLSLQEYSDCFGRTWYDTFSSEYEELVESERQLVLLSAHPRLRVAIAGAFSSGKSAFINYILKSRNVAVEGACPTTRSGTEYVYGDVTKYCIARDARWFEITPSQYREESCKEDSSAGFRVEVRSKLLRDYNLTLVDTPGFDGSKSDCDTAKSAIREADVIFWIVNAASGELRKDECSYLCEVSKGGDIPVALVITQIEGVSSFCGSKLKGLEIVCKKILDTANKPIWDNVNKKARHLRISGNVVTMSSKPEGVKIPSIKSLVAHQDENIDAAFRLCCERALVAVGKKKKNVEDCARRVRSGLIKDLLAKAESLAEGISGLESSITRRRGSIRRNFRDAVQSRMNAYFERIDLGTAISVSLAKDIFYIWYKPYRAVFDLDVSHFDSAAILEIVHGVCGGQNVVRNDIVRGLLRVKGYLDLHVKKSMVNDDWTHDADKRAREEMRKAVGEVCYKWSSELANEFCEGIVERYEACDDDECRKWICECDQIKAALTCIDNFRRDMARQGLLWVLKARVR